MELIGGDPGNGGDGLTFPLYTTQQSGSSGPQVTAVQTLLTQQKYSPGKVDGLFGATTKSAVEKFQRDRSLDADGMVGPKTWTALLSAGSTPLLKQGGSGDAVKRLQRALTAALGKTVGVDGSFGPATDSAVCSYSDHPASWASTARWARPRGRPCRAESEHGPGRDPPEHGGPARACTRTRRRPGRPWACRPTDRPASVVVCASTRWSTTSCTTPASPAASASSGSPGQRRPAVPELRPGARLRGPRLRASPRRDTDAWSAVAAVLGAGLRYEGLEPCGCGKRPRFRPRTGAGGPGPPGRGGPHRVPVAEALARRDPAVPEEDD